MKKFTIIPYMTVNRNLLTYAKEQEKKSKEFKNFTRGISTEITKLDYIETLINFLKFHKLENQYDKVSKFNAKKLMS